MKELKVLILDKEDWLSPEGGAGRVEHDDTLLSNNGDGCGSLKVVAGDRFGFFLGCGFGHGNGDGCGNGLNLWQSHRLYIL